MRPAIRQMMDAAQHIDFERPQDVRVFMIAIIDELANLDRSVSASLGYSEKEREPLSGGEKLEMKEIARNYAEAFMADRDGSEPLAAFIKHQAVATLAGVPMEQAVRDMAAAMHQAAAKAHREGEPRRGRPASILIQPGDMVQLGHGDDESLVSDGWYMVAEVRPVGSFTVAGHEKTGVGPERVIRWFRGEKQTISPGFDEKDQSLAASFHEEAKKAFSEACAQTPRKTTSEPSHPGGDRS